MIGKGNTKNSYTIDRRFSIYGYHWWNIQVMTRSDNSSKGNRDIKILQYDYITDTAKVYRKKPNTETNNPF
jgi:hypothetical protein